MDVVAKYLDVLFSFDARITFFLKNSFKIDAIIGTGSLDFRFEGSKEGSRIDEYI